MKTQIIIIITFLLILIFYSEFSCQKPKDAVLKGPDMFLTFKNKYSKSQLFDLALLWMKCYDTTKLCLEFQDKNEGILKGKYSFLLKNHLWVNIITQDLLISVRKDTLSVVINNIHYQKNDKSEAKPLMMSYNKQAELEKEWDKVFKSFFMYMESSQNRVNYYGDSIVKNIPNGL